MCGLSCSRLSIAEPVQLQNVVRETDHGPLPLHVLQTPQEELPEAARLFDLSKHRLHDRFAPGVDGRSHLGLQFPAHAVHPCRSLGKRPSRARLLAVTIRLPVGRDETFDLFLLQVLQISLRTIPTVGHNFLRRLSRLLACVTLCPTIHCKSGSTAIWAL